MELTNIEIMNFNSPVMQQLFTDKERIFPVQDAFRLTAFIQSLKGLQDSYNSVMKDIIEKHEGKIDPKTGIVTYPSQGDEDKAVAECNQLNEVVVNVPLPGGKFTITPEWPKLTLAEAMILKPLIKEDKGCQTSE